MSLSLAIPRVVLGASGLATVVCGAFPGDSVGQTTPAPRQLKEPIETNPQADLLDWAVGSAQIVGVVIAAVAAVFIYFQIRDGRKSARVERSLAYLQRYAERELRQRVAAVTAYLSVSNTRQCVVHIQAWQVASHAEAATLPRAKPAPSAPRASKNDVREVLDFFEELGAAFNRGLLDNDVVLRTIGSIPAPFLERAWWFIVWRRRGRSVPDTQLYAELENMVRALQMAEPASKRFKPNDEIRLLAELDPDATAEDWEQCGRLAECLSDALGREKPRLLDCIPATDAPVPRLSKSSINLIAVPADLDDPQLARRKELVAETQARLVGLPAHEVEAIIQRLCGKEPEPTSGVGLSKKTRDRLRTLRRRFARLREALRSIH